ncbi:WD40 repeat-like protein [Backusella circina FSU 941]|nr:WD40 repeat-like protein [Backusella circina FSU 941]
MDIIYSNLYKHSFYQSKISPDEKWLANAIDNRLVIRHNTAELGIVAVQHNQKPIDFIQWSPDSTCILALNYETARIQIWSITDMDFTAVIKDTGFGITSIQWNSNSSAIICTSELFLRLSIWDIESKKMEYIEHLKYANKGIEKSPNMKYTAIVQAQNGKEYLSFYSNSFVLMQKIELETVDLENIKWSPDSLAIAVWDNCLYHNVWVYALDGRRLTSYSGYKYGLGIKTVSWNTSIQILAVANYDQTVHLLSTTSWKLITILNHPSLLSHDDNMRLVEEYKLPPTATPTLEPDVGCRLISRRPFNLISQKPEKNVPNPKMGIGACQFSEDGLYLFSKNDNMPNVIWIWNTTTLKCHTIIKLLQPVRQAIWHPHYNYLAIVSDSTTIEEVQLGPEETDIRQIKVPTSDFNVRKVKWSPNGESLLLKDQQFFCLAIM